MISQTLYFIRHGRTAWNAERRYQGQIDIPLDDVGREQASRNGAVLAGFFAEHSVAIDDLDFVASPLSRTRETMHRIRDGLGLPHEGYRTDSRLIEASYGDWEGLTIPEIRQERPGELERRHAEPWTYEPPHGESYMALSSRVADWLGGVERPTVVVSHGGVCRVLQGLLLGMPRGELPMMDIPQDKVFVWRRGAAVWL